MAWNEDKEPEAWCDRVEPRDHPQVCWIRHEDHRCMGIIQPGDITHAGDHMCCCAATWPSPVPRTAPEGEECGS